MKILVSFLLLAVSASVAVTNYDGFKVLRVIPETFRAKERFRSLIEELQILKVLPHGENVAYDVVVSPNKLDTFKLKMKQLNIDVTMTIEDVQELIDDQSKLNKIAKKRKHSRILSGIDHSYYRTLDEINLELDNLVNSFPTLMTKTSIGVSYDGRDMNIMKVSSGGNDTREVIWLDCGIHPREWVATASCLFFLDSLSTYGSDSEITTLVDTYDFLVLTVPNPDGYDYTWTNDRLWRKNRFPSGTCYGVDLNRNFDADWGGPGTSDQPCSDIYDGLSAFSELETQAIRDTVNSYNGRIKMFFSIHSYSQLWMYPYAYTNSLPADSYELDRVAGIGVEALTSIYGTRYDYGSIANTIYLSAGNPIDWTYDTAGILYSYTLELRDTGSYGFEIPPYQIDPTATETWIGIKAAINEV